MDATNVQGVIDALEGKYKGVKSRLCDEDGRLRSYVRVFVNGERPRPRRRQAPLKAGDSVSIVPAIAGGF